MLLAQPPTPLEWILRAVSGTLLVGLPATLFGDVQTALAAFLYGAMLLPLGAFEAWLMRRSRGIQRLALPAAWLLAGVGIMVVNVQAAFTQQILQGKSAAVALEQGLSALSMFKHLWFSLPFLGHAFLFAACTALRVRGLRGARLFAFQLGATLFVFGLQALSPGPGLGFLLWAYLLWVFAGALPLAGELGEVWARHWEATRVASA